MDEIRARFKITGPELDRDEILVGPQGLRAGRGADNNLVLNHREMSRAHLHISYDFENDKYQIEDLNSANGVWLNDVRIPSREKQQIQEGDVIRCGPYLFTFVGLVYPEPVALLERPEVAEEQELAALDGRVAGHLIGIPRDQSTWMQYLPAIYAEDEFLGRYMLIFESILSPIVWLVDGFDMHLAPETAPAEWLQWMASWFDVLILPEVPIDRQREILRQVGWLFLRRGTRSGLQRLLNLYFGVQAEIVETGNCQFVVRLPLRQVESNIAIEMTEGPSTSTRERPITEDMIKKLTEVADRLISSQKPAFASYSLEII